jgi:predicted permease
MLDILNIVLPAFIVIFIGYLFGKISKKNVSPLVDVAFNIGGPALTLVSMLEKKIILLDAAKIWGAAFFIMVGCGVVAWIVFRIFKQKHSSLYLSVAIMNTVNIPFPIIYLAYGAPGLLAATLFFIPNVILLYSAGIFIAAGGHWKEGMKEVLKVPTLVLIVLGYNLSKVRLSSLSTTFLASFLRVGIGLALGLLAVNLFNLDGVFKSVVILDSAMPSAVNASVIAAKYDREADLVSSVVFVTTIISLVSIPFLLAMLT